MRKFFVHYPIDWSTWDLKEFDTVDSALDFISSKVRGGMNDLSQYRLIGGDDLKLKAVKVVDAIGLA